MGEELNTLEKCLEDLRTTLENNYGRALMQDYTYPLMWYIGSGRSTREFEKRFVEKYKSKKDTLIKWMIKNQGLDDRCIGSICQCIGYRRK